MFDVLAGELGLAGLRALLLDSVVALEELLLSAKRVHTRLVGLAHVGVRLEHRQLFRVVGRTTATLHKLSTFFFFVVSLNIEASSMEKVKSNLRVAHFI